MHRGYYTSIRILSLLRRIFVPCTRFFFLFTHYSQWRGIAVVSAGVAFADAEIVAAAAVVAAGGGDGGWGGWCWQWAGDVSVDWDEDSATAAAAVDGPDVHDDYDPAADFEDATPWDGGDDGHCHSAAADNA